MVIACGLSTFFGNIVVNLLKSFESPSAFGFRDKTVGLTHEVSQLNNKKSCYHIYVFHELYIYFIFAFTNAP